MPDMKPYRAEKAELSHRKSKTKPLPEKNGYTVSDENIHTDDDDAVPNRFDQHLVSRTRLDAQNSTTPLIDYCINDWKETPYHRDYHDPLEGDFEDDPQEWYDCLVQCLRVRKARRWALFVTSVFIFFFYLCSTIWSRKVEERMLTESLQLRDKAETRKLYGGVFGNSMRPSFSNMIHIKTLNQHFLTGKHAAKERGRLMFVGDIHGCKEDLQALLEEVRFDPKKDHLVTTGDMIAKGPDSSGTVDLLREIGASCVRGNHDDRILLLAKASNTTRIRQNAGGTAEDVYSMAKSSKQLPKSLDESLSTTLNAAQIDYLQSCPVILKVGHIDALQGGVVVVHAGLVPGVPLEDQDPSSVMTMRTIDLRSHVPSKDGREGPVQSTNKETPETTPIINWPGRKPPYHVHWVKLWNHFQKMMPASNQERGDERMVVVYGHDSKRGLQVREWSRGLDTGCVNGGRLTALVVGDEGKSEELVSVKCRGYRS